MSSHATDLPVYAKSSSNSNLAGVLQLSNFGLKSWSTGTRWEMHCQVSYLDNALPIELLKTGQFRSLITFGL